MEIFNKDGHMLELIKEAIEYYVEFFDSNRDLYRILTHSPWILKDISDHFYKNIISQLQMVRRRVFNLTREGIVKPTDFYTVFYGILECYRGRFKETRKLVDKLSEIADVYEHEWNKSLKYDVNIRFLINRRKLPEALDELEEGIAFSHRLDYKRWLFSFYTDFYFFF